MKHHRVGPQFALSWLEARYIAHRLPAPVHDYGAFRIETNSVMTHPRAATKGLAHPVQQSTSMLFSQRRNLADDGTEPGQNKCGDRGQGPSRMLQIT